MLNIVAIIPCYNHGNTVAAVVQQLRQHELVMVLVNDGSNAETTAALRQLKNDNDVFLLELETNQGKGGAVMAGMTWAYQQGYSHGLQVDADGQHDLAKIPNLIALASDNPKAVISGQPIYGDDVPKGRLYGRYATHVSVWIETLSLQIRDSMCGFRIYPLAATYELISTVKLGRRMDFDIEILVRLYWQGLDIQFLPIAVHYPEDGVSHFDALWDNVKISWLHTRLITQMLFKSPTLIRRHFSASQNNHWSKHRERGSYLGIMILLKSYQLFGRKAFSLMLHPVIAFYYLTDANARATSTQYRQKLTEFAKSRSHSLPTLSSYRHIYSFGQNMLDKLAAWGGHIGLDSLDFSDEALLQSVINSNEGAVILASHLGNIELCRALSGKYTELTINALVFTEHAETFNSVMKQVNPNSNLNLIQVTELGPDTAILLEQKLSQGEWVVIVGDRTSVTQHKRVVWQSFLGTPAPFPQGPFMLAGLLKHPVYTMFGFANNDRYDIFFEPFEQHPSLPRGQRQQALQQLVAKYAQRLEHYALRYPLQWYNFFDFWTCEHDS
ncbi:glycosyltransferase family 2 protein [Paraferrimonas haliotis]|uniref:Acyltransferase n=1 Tax=Paraferrimonas haliotis TaxID=2013866 RepID=A0AA37TUI1_9GAMM|nr:glycosyltransferase family 2 protein [Paraferrimonas haliotis]GLS83169.1 acyltransferase [Paraferrimonas haliotis]